MAILRCEGEYVAIKTRHIFGRDPNIADTLLSNLDASLFHLVIAWNETQWGIVDHSRNGTFVDGVRLKKNIKMKLEVGQKIQCGPNGQTSWWVEDLEPPHSMLLPMNAHTPLLILDRPLCLPDTKRIAAIVHFVNGDWVLSNIEGDEKKLVDGETFSLSDNTWKFASASAVDFTSEAYNAIDWEEITFHFLATQDEENVFLTIEHAGSKIDLGERVHHQSLLELARRRYQDQQSGYDEFSQGWVYVSDFAKQLRLDETHLNTHLSRARAQIGTELSHEISTLPVIERRRGKIRFGSVSFQIMRGMEIESRFIGRTAGA